MKPEYAEEYTQALAQAVHASYRQIALGHKLGVPKALGFKGKDATRQWVLQRLGGYIQMQITERKRAELELKAEGFSNRVIAQLVGVAEATVRNDLGAQSCADELENGREIDAVEDDSAQSCAPEEPFDPETGEIMEDDGVVDPAPAAEVVVLDAVPSAQKTRSANERQRKAELERPAEISLPTGIHHGDFRELADQIADASVQLVFTDPPYDKSSVQLYEDAARVARRILKPGGSFVAYSGQRYLPDVLNACARHLDYYWTFAGVHEGGNQVLNKLGIRCGWKPLVWFVKGTRGDVQNILLDVVRGDREKDAHEWQQAEAEALYFIEKLTTESGFVVDFFIGSGTTAKAAQKINRQFIGFEVKSETAMKAMERVMEAAE
jgi:hypothetical protein